jgi:hypothetical protein
VREVGVAFLNDEVTAQVVASRLGAAGIASRVDRGLVPTGQVAHRGQITVLVDARQAAKARKLLGTTPDRSGTPEPLLRVAIAALTVVIGLGVAVVAALLVLR